MDQSTAIVKSYIEKPIVFVGVDFKRWQQKMLPVDGDIPDEIVKASEAWTQNEFLCS